MAVRQIVSLDEALAPGRKEVVEDSGQNTATCVTQCLLASGLSERAPGQVICHMCMYLKI